VARAALSRALRFLVLDHCVDSSLFCSAGVHYLSEEVADFFELRWDAFGL
jgi:hypothetical protein